MMFLLVLQAKNVIAEATGLKACKSLQRYESVRLKWVYDGDTIQLSDGRKIRLIGINTPEISHNKKAAQAYSQQALQYLKTRLTGEDRLFLTWDKDKRDKYSRYLAYVSLADGSDVQAESISQGLAMSIVVPPNDQYLACYRQLESTARKQKRGIWTQAKYQIIKAEELSYSIQGYRFISGKIIKLIHLKQAVLLQLANNFSVYVPNKVFAELNKKTKVGEQILVRGWISYFRKKPQIKLYHAANIELL